MTGSIQEIIEHLSRHKLRTALTGFAVGWGVLLLIFLLGVGTSFESGLRSSTTGYNIADLRLYAWFTTKPYSGFAADRSIIFDDLDIALIKQVAPEVKSVYKTVTWGGKELRTKDTYYTEFFNISGVHPAMFRSNIAITLKQGRFLTDEDYNKALHHYIIPDNIATTLFPKDSTFVGKQIIVNGIQGTIVGVYQKSTFGNNIVYLPFSEAALRVPEVATNNLELALDLGGKVLTGKEAKALGEKIRVAIARKKQFDPTDENAVYLNTWNIEGASSFDNFFRRLQAFLWVVGLSILAIGIVGVSNIMLVAVSERRKEIGIRKALGARSRHLIGMVLGESLIITLISGLLGLAIGVAILLFLDYAIIHWKIGELSMFGETIHLLGSTTVSIGLGLAAIAVMLVAGIIAGYRPARRASNIPAVEAMSDKAD